jgi:hypothetical protein
MRESRRGCMPSLGTRIKKVYEKQVGHVLIVMS